MSVDVVAAPAAEDTYIARREDLRLVLEPRQFAYGPNGARLSGEVPGLTVKFSHGQLRVPRSGTMLAEDGRRVEVERVRDHLERHKLLGDTDEGFTKMVLSAPAPSSEEMTLLNTASTMLDVDKIDEFLAAERAGWNRPALVALAEGARERVLEAGGAQAEALAATEARAAAAEARVAELEAAAKKAGAARGAKGEAS